MSFQRKLYLFTTAVFCIGAVLAVAVANYSALFIFLVLAAFVFWISTRIDGIIAERWPEQAPSGTRRDARDTQRSPRKQGGGSGRGQGGERPRGSRPRR